MILAFLLVQAAAAATPAPAPRAADRQPPATVMAEPIALAFAGWDGDGDGRTSRAEAMAGAGRSFAALDAGRRGSIGYIGFADWAERWLGDRAALPSPFEIDADADDRISKAEFDAGMTRAFDRIDKDKDGVLTRAEMLTIRPGLREPNERRRRGGRRES
jgi:hypothetical protein